MHKFSQSESLKDVLKPVITRETEGALKQLSASIFAAGQNLQNQTTTNH